MKSYMYIRRNDNTLSFFVKIRSKACVFSFLCKHSLVIFVLCKLRKTLLTCDWLTGGTDRECADLRLAVSH